MQGPRSRTEPPWHRGKQASRPVYGRRDAGEVNIDGYVMIDYGATTEPQGVSPMVAAARWPKVRAGGAKLATLNIEYDEISRPAVMYSLTMDMLLSTATARSTTVARARNTPCGLRPMGELSPK